MQQDFRAEASDTITFPVPETPSHIVKARTDHLPKSVRRAIFKKAMRAREEAEARKAREEARIAEETVRDPKPQRQVGRKRDRTQRARFVRHSPAQLLHR